ncbi:hypothetical protein AB4212_41190, partial [Streptomyces sp. 2MCAF27]
MRELPGRPGAVLPQGQHPRLRAPDPAEPGAHTQGGYSEAIVAPEDFVVRVPETLDPAAAAPLLCAGITVYSPLKRFGARPGTKVVVVGHLGVKMAKAMGADVAVLLRGGSSRRPDRVRRGRAQGLAGGEFDR